MMLTPDQFEHVDVPVPFGQPDNKRPTREHRRGWHSGADDNAGAGVDVHGVGGTVPVDGRDRMRPCPINRPPRSRRRERLWLSLLTQIRTRFLAVGQMRLLLNTAASIVTQQAPCSASLTTCDDWSHHEDGVAGQVRQVERPRAPVFVVRRPQNPVVSQPLVTHFAGCSNAHLCRKVCGRYGLRLSAEASTRLVDLHYPCSDSHFQNADGASTWMPRNGFKVKRS